MLRGARRFAALDARRGEVLAVAGLFLVTALYLCIQAARVQSYIWLVDEFLYSKAAQGFAQGSLHAQIFSVHTSVPNVLYAWFIAAPYWVLSNIHAFKVAHLLDGLAFASAVVPLYLTARLLGATRGWSLFGAALGTWIPWAVAVNVLMSESLAYAAFCWATYAIVAAIALARPWVDAVAIVLIGIAALARTQLIVLLPVFVIALVLHELSWPGEDRAALRERARGHWVVGAAVVVGLIVLAVAGNSVLGHYSETAHLGRFPKDLASSMADHLGHIIVGCGVVPAILWAVGVLRAGTAPLRRSEHAFAIVSGLALVLIIYQAGFFALQVAGGQLQERYAFYVVAFFAVGAAAVLSDRVRIGTVAAPIAAGVVAAVIVGSANYPVGIGAFATLVSAASGYDDELAKAVAKVAPSWTPAGGLVLATLVLAALIAVVLTVPRWRRWSAPVLAALVLIFCATETHTVMNRVITGMNSAYPGMLGGAPKSWVDGILYTGNDQAAALDDSADDAQGQVWIWTEFWNTRIIRRYKLNRRQTTGDNLPHDPIAFDPATGRLATAHEEPALVVAASDPTLSVRGKAIRTTTAGQSLILPARPYQADWAYGRANGDNALRPQPTTLSLYPPTAGARTAHVSFQLAAAPGKPVAWQANGAKGRLAGGAKATVRLDVPAGAGAERAIVQLTASQPGRATIAGERVSWT